MSASDSEEEAPPVDFTKWAPVFGEWELSPDVARYVGPSPVEEPQEPVGFGILLSPFDLASGAVVVDTRFPASDESQPQGRVVFGFDSATLANYAAGIGGYRRHYVVEQFVPGDGWRAIRTSGNADQIVRDVDHEIVVAITGTRAVLHVNGVEVHDAFLPAPLSGTQVGLTAWGNGPVEFRDFRLAAERPDAFVVMKFGEPYDSLYREVIAPVTERAGYDVVRADEFSGPGIIVDDIVQAIHRADVVIAEITPVNANVFYELGYAHALGKSTILLAERGQDLPFDVSGWRCIFYENTIGGRTHVEQELGRHLDML